ncbi:hypothetical protein AJ87_07485 [Rhizobium yanglingense]|nr:hypothetical protein AJ87_07485 [Rhizobium yanglingense]
MKVHRAIAVVIAAFISFAAIIDPDGSGPEANFLQSVAESLDEQGVDIVLGAASDGSPGERPRLAALSG